MLKQYKTMDIDMLISIINMKLRDGIENINELCKEFDIDIREFKEYLISKGCIINLNRIERK